MSDFATYLLFRSEIQGFLPWISLNWPAGNLSAEKAFSKFDSEGKIIGSTHPKMVQWALEGKKLLNFHIKMWAEGLSEVPMFELKEDYYYMPDWVWKAVIRQSYSLGGKASAG